MTLLKITCTFLLYDLTNVEKDICRKCQTVGGKELVLRLPKLPSKVSGDTDILMGIKYLKYLFEIRNSQNLRIALMAST